MHTRERFEQLDDTGTVMVPAERFPFGKAVSHCPAENDTNIAKHWQVNQYSEHYNMGLKCPLSVCLLVFSISLSIRVCVCVCVNIGK